MQNENRTFYWYDFETWGLSPSLDRPAQFAGIRTDLQFNIIDEPDMFYCQLSDDYLPHPESAFITGITPEITQREGIPEFKFAHRIHQRFSTANTCVTGFNSIRFDEEFTRNIFYRNFYDPYEYTWKKGNSRWDIMDLVRATYALRPDGINWPVNETGLPSFRLELLTQANDISHESAHDALSDVYATIAIAKLIKAKSPRIFDYYFELRNKNKVKALIDIKNFTPLVHVSGMFGAARGNISFIVPVVWHPINKNALVVIDLAKDISPLLELSVDEIRERLYTKHDELGELSAIPLKLVHINKCPFLAPTNTLLPKNAERLAIDHQVCQRNLHTLKTNPKLSQVVSEVFLQEREFEHHGNVDAMLYDGFFSDGDKRAFEKIRKTNAENLAQLKLSIADTRFDELFFRYRARNFPQTMTKDEQNRWGNHCRSALEFLTADYFSNIDSLTKEFQHDEEKIRILTSLFQYAQTLFDSLSLSTPRSDYFN